MARDLLLEIGTEEIPSRFLPPALSQIARAAGNILEKNRLGCRDIFTYATPRRLVLFVHQLAERQDDIKEKVKGPARRIAFDDEGAPTKAARGFAQSQGVSVDDLQGEIINGTEYVFAVKEIAGKETAELLPELLPSIIAGITFPKPMFWEEKNTRFARPIRWLLALFDEDAVSFAYAGLQSSRETRGHRFLAPGPFTVDNPGHYFRLLEESHVVLDQERRRDLIRQQVEEVAAQCGGRALIDEALLEEVNYLVEYPSAVVGSFQEEFLMLPREVLITTMQVHQRYFAVNADDNGELLPYFVVISNTSSDNAENVRSGNEKVLRARLSDARFFYEEDRRQPLGRYVERLKGIIYQEELGTVYDKQQRIAKLAGYLSRELALSEKEKGQVKGTAALCKADLATSMVAEFPELQGVMGREYAQRDGEDPVVAAAIYEHYLPRFTGDSLPETKAGTVVSIADKIDTVAGCFKVGIEPTGSQDPYALRRQSLGIVAILIEGGYSIDLESLIERALALFDLADENRGDLVEKIAGFFRQRINFVLESKGYAADLIEAVLHSTGYTNPALYFRRISAVDSLRSRPVFERLLTAYTRVANLARKAEWGGELQEALFKEKAEKELYAAYCQSAEKLYELWEKGQYEAYLEELVGLQTPIDTFFDAVMVMVEDDSLRANRLGLLKEIRDLFLRMADFACIQN